MDNPIEKFDPSTLMQGVKDRIKATFVSLIPDAQWETMVQKEIDAFFEMRKTNISKTVSTTVSWQTDREASTLTAEQLSSPFRDLVWDHCSKITIEILKEKITKDYFHHHLEDGEWKLPERMQEIVISAAPLAAAKFFEQISRSMLNSLQQVISNVRVY